MTHFYDSHGPLLTFFLPLDGKKIQILLYFFSRCTGVVLVWYINYIFFYDFSLWWWRCFLISIFFSFRIGGSRLMKRRSWRRPQIQPPDWSIRADERIGPLSVGGDGSRRIEGGNSVTTTPIDVPIDEFFEKIKY